MDLQDATNSRQNQSAAYTFPNPNNRGKTTTQTSFTIKLQAIIVYNKMETSVTKIYTAFKGEISNHNKV